MSPILYAIPFFLLLVAIEMLLARAQHRKIYRFHDTLTSLNIGFVSETLRSLAKLMSLAVYAVVVDQASSITWDTRHPAVWVLAFFMYDFFYYWAHRCGHEVNLLWASHVVHHSSEDFNLATAFRQSWTNQFFYWVFYLPMALVGIPVTVFAITALVSAIYQFWVHTQLIRTLGWAERVLVTPSNHRVHHGRNPYCINRNYGGTLILWDRWFGTYAAERPDEPVVYGTLVPLRSWSPLWGNVKNFVGLCQDVVAQPGWRHKLMVVFAPPGWTASAPPTARPALAAAAPLPLSAPAYDTPAGPWHKVYGLGATAAILALVLDLLTSLPVLSLPQRLAYTLLIVLSTASLARLFEHQRGGAALETLRTVLLFGPLAAGWWFHPVPLAGRLAGAAVLLLLLFALALHHRGPQGNTDGTTARPGQEVA